MKAFFDIKNGNKIENNIEAKYNDKAAGDDGPDMEIVSYHCSGLRKNKTKNDKDRAEPK